MTFSNWFAGEPNNAFGGGVEEDYVAAKWANMFNEKWNDLTNDELGAGSRTYGILEAPKRSWLWSTGQTTSSITVTPSITTKYLLTVSDQFGSCTDSVNVSVLSGVGYNPLQEITRVCGDSASLDAGPGFAQYNWSNGATTQKISVKIGGKYSVTVTNASGCDASDSTYLSLVNAKIIQRDTTICKGASITLNVDSTISGTSNSSLSTNLRNGLVAYYPFNGNSNDESGNGVNAVNYNSVLTQDRFGNSNSAYSLNGFNSYLETGLISQMNGASKFSIGLWVKVKGNNFYDSKFPDGDAQFLISRESDNTSEHFSFLFGVDHYYTGQLKIGSTHTMQLHQ